MQQQDEGDQTPSYGQQVNQLGLSININTILTALAVSGVCYCVTILLQIDKSNAVQNDILQNMGRTDLELLKYAHENRDRIIKLEGKVFNK